MIRIEITCDHSTQPRAHDAKHPCDSTRNRSLSIDACGTMDDAVRAVGRVAIEKNWHRALIPNLGRRMGYICHNCYRRMKGEI